MDLYIFNILFEILIGTIIKEFCIKFKTFLIEHTIFFIKMYMKKF